MSVRPIPILAISLTIGLCAMVISCSDDSSEPTNPAGGGGHGVVADDNPLVVLRQADTVLTHYEGLVGMPQAVDSLATWFASLANVRTAEACDDSISVDIVFADGLRAGYCVTDPFSAVAKSVAIEPAGGAPAGGLAKQAHADVRVMDGSDATIAVVFKGSTAPDRHQIDVAIEITRDSLEQFEYAVAVHDTTTTTFDIAYFDNLFSNPPAVLTIFTHGVLHDSTCGLATREEYPDDEEEDTNSIGAFRMRRGPTYKALRAPFVEESFRATGPCFLSLHACHAGSDSALMAAFMEHADSIVVLTHSRRARMDHIRAITEHMYECLTDTFTIQQAYDDLSNRHASMLLSKPDADVLLGETFTCNVGPSRDHFMGEYHTSTTHVDGTPIDAFTMSADCCGSDSGGMCDTSISIVVPATVGTYTCDDGVVVTVPCGGLTRIFAAVIGSRGVSASVTINSIQDGFISGSYRATVGYWTPGRSPAEVDPDTTLSLQGRFKIE